MFFVCFPINSCLIILTGFDTSMLDYIFILFVFFNFFLLNFVVVSIAWKKKQFQFQNCADFFSYKMTKTILVSTQDFYTID